MRFRFAFQSPRNLFFGETSFELCFSTPVVGWIFARACDARDSRGDSGNVNRLPKRLGLRQGICRVINGSKFVNRAKNSK